MDSIENAPDSSLWHTLIEADNYHALQLLEYLYEGQVDCIYIDPPYNTGAKDWKYNNDYVDSSDAYRHSKWLSMMAKRLKLAKKLLNPADSVLIVTIDEKEYLHLGCLLEELFPDARMQMVSVAIHASGVARAEFSRTDEYYFFVFIGKSSPSAISLENAWREDGVKRQTKVRWESMLRSGHNGRRIDSPNLFYPVLFDKKSQQVVAFGASIPFSMSGDEYVPPEGMVAVLPYSSSGEEAVWRISNKRAEELMSMGAFDWGEYKGGKTALKYLKQGELKKVEDSIYKVIGHKPNGAMILSSDEYTPTWVPG
ncbi:site-specific DNA-methyltransferase, partial [Bifidobacteriaceae bacterium NR015]